MWHGAGGNPAVTFEQVRFYAPTTSAFPIYLGNVVVDACPGADRCGAPMTFNTALGGNLTASAAFESAGAAGRAIVYQDLSPNYGGLGVAKLRTNSRGQARVVGDEEIDAGDRLKLSFAQQVNVVGFHFSKATTAQPTRVTLASSASTVGRGSASRCSRTT